jgi:ABC-2 type transport system ATP-binding protein
VQETIMRVEVEDVGRRFGSLVALKGVSFTLPDGGRAALIGPNGSGKSTLIRVLMGMLRCDGAVRLAGGSPFADREQVAPRLAYVPQIAPRFCATVREVVRAVTRLRGIPSSRVGSIASRLQLDIDAVGRQPFRNLSGGMRQKLLLALALATDASLLILDEPTASLDAGARQRFFTLMEELPPTTSILLCSHRLEEIRHLVDRVLVLEDGRLVHDGAAAEYLRGRAPSRIEVLPEGEHAERWLDGSGFRRGTSGWWTRAVCNRERVALVAAVTASLGKDIADLVVREQELDDPGADVEES